MNINFDFLEATNEEASTPQPDYVGPNLKAAAKMTPKKFANAVLEVFDRLGGASWLITQAEADPKAFLSLLQRMIPKSIQLDDLQGVQINLIDQFGNRVEIETTQIRDSAAEQSLQDETATSGSLPTLQSQHSTLLPSVAIKDIF